ncbi:Mini-ribonuclease 3 [Marinisporobacter balticus]|uniref:Mini-ribonuclease 3 n=1 Tax=Marinisporobacter balticus TaxID=2018667 RepID=A0A4R2KQR7_9FIRM|nr:ribonuclease III domain-containing protein [Marinisporobacter balticus]TCO75037.1 ribonuclease-3 family protein [Marinisporobacter balticus]
MDKNFIEYMNLAPKSEQDVKFVPPLVLAYIGDAVYEVYVRQFIIYKYGGNVNKLHKLSTKFVKAEAQAKIAHAIEEELSEEEWTMIKKGRNQKSGTVPKNADLTDYKYATGFEALIGYLYLLGKTKRIEEIVKRGIQIIEA